MKHAFLLLNYEKYVRTLSICGKLNIQYTFNVICINDKYPYTMEIYFSFNLYQCIYIKEKQRIFNLGNLVFMIT